MFLDWNQVTKFVVECFFEKESPFLKLWLQSFINDYKVGKWAYNSGIAPYRLAKRYPDQVCTESSRIYQQPDYFFELLLSRRMAWNDMFLIHLYTRKWWIFEWLGYNVTGESIKEMDSTVGDIARHILHSSEARS